MALIDIFTLFTSIIAAIGLILVALQVREAEKSRHLDSTWTVISYFSSEENRSLRRYIYNDLPENVNNLSIDSLSKVMMVCGSFERLALLANKGLADKQIIIEYYVEAIIICWGKLFPFIKSYREIHSFPLYMNGFERLADDAEQYWKKTFKNTPWPQAYKMNKYDDQNPAQSVKQ